MYDKLNIRNKNLIKNKVHINEKIDFYRCHSLYPSL